MSDLEHKIDALTAEVRELRKLLVDRSIQPVRLAIARSVGKQVSDLWPDQEQA